uniref:PQQ-dependent sugar dehydrogenase n=1 Tax=uncultured Oxalicibacterium sp. TaxID=1168540 RepID=UPI0025E55DE1
GKAWQGSLFVGSLVFRNLERLEVKDGKVVQREKLLPDLNARVRDVREGPDGYLYLATDEADGRIIKVLPAAAR